MVKLAAESKIRKCQCCKTVMYIFFSFDQRETPEWFLAVAKINFLQELILQVRVCRANSERKR
jgi:hypothetical protein